MEDRDVRASPRHDQSSLSAPHSASLPSMHAPHQTTQQQHEQQQQQQHQQQHSHPYPPSHSTQYAASSTPVQPHQQRHYYDHHRDGPGPQLQPQHQPQHYEYARQAPAPVALPSIQHLDAANAAPTSTTMSGTENNSSSNNNNNNPSASVDNSTGSRQTLPPPLPPQQQQHPQTAHSYAAQPSTMNGDSRHPYAHHPPSAYAPQYPPRPYQGYATGEFHHHAPPHHQPPQPLPPNALMPSSVHNGHPPAIRYGLAPSLQLDPRQMSGGRHKKEIKRRTKTGCLTCRKRRIKCDERHPHCRNCEKSKRDCLGYDPVFKSQPAPPTLQPAPLPNQIIKTEPPYRYAYHNPEDIYAARPGQPPQPQQQHPPTPAPMQPLAPPLVNGGYPDHGAAPLADGDHNRGQTHAHSSSTDLSSKR